MPIRVIVNGAQGKMGQETVKAILQDPQLQLVAALGRLDSLDKNIRDNQADVVVDFTTPAAVYENTRMILAENARPVIGTTGFTPEQISELQQIAAAKKLGGVIAPNFSLGAVLMMRFAREAARYLNHVEILEMHHPQKKDAPSGTAIKTAEMIAEYSHAETETDATHELFKGARGARCQRIPIHSIRLPGLVAHQQVIFGAVGETLTLRHDAIHRECFMPGVLLACKKVMELDQLFYGLENTI